MPDTLKHYLSLLESNLINLPGEPAHLEMYPTRARTSEAIQTNDYRLSAVMALIYQYDEHHRLILIERPQYNGNHSGQIGFPGGKTEPEDLDSQATAIRETLEEIGIGPEHYRIAGKLSAVFIPVSKFLVHPYIGFMRNRPQYVLDHREVKAVFDIGLHELLNPAHLQVTEIKTSNGVMLKDIPAFVISDRVIWGATALMLNELRHLLIRIDYPLTPGK